MTARSSALVMILQIINLGTNFFLAFLLANYLGKDSFGVYTFIIACVRLLAIPVSMGFPTLLAKELAIHRSASAWGKFTGLWKLSRDTVSVASLIACAGGALLAMMIYQGDENRILRLGFFIGLLLVPLITHTWLRQAACRALRRAELGALPESGVKPVLVIILILLAHTFLGEEFGELWALALNVTATGIAFVMGVWLLGRIFPQEASTATLNNGQNKQWRRTASSFLLIAGIHVINMQADKVMLGSFGWMDSVGVYFIACKIAGLATFFLLAMNSVASPKYAEIFRSEGAGSKRLGKLVSTVALIAFGGAVMVSGVVYFFGDFILSIFGKGFGEAQLPIAILLLGQLVSVFCGASANLLNMTGHERVVAWGVGIGAVANIVLNAALIPNYGMVGAAIATSGSMCVWNIIFVIQVFKKMRLNPTPLGVFAKTA